MEKKLFATANCKEMPVRYYLITEEERYGIGVEYGEEAVLIRDLSGTVSTVERLLTAMAQGSVTPVTARDVAEDWLLS